MKGPKAVGAALQDPPAFLPPMPVLLSSNTTCENFLSILRTFPPAIQNHQSRSLPWAQSFLESLLVFPLEADFGLPFPFYYHLSSLPLSFSCFLETLFVLFRQRNSAGQVPICRLFFRRDLLLAKRHQRVDSLERYEDTTTPFLHPTMAQARGTGFNPSSPHSSSGAGDSYKHEGTPDTRLTAFSPDDNSARSNKLPVNRTLTINTATSQDAHPHHFHSHNSSDGYSVTPGGSSDKDPFISTSTISKPDQKLSPTASSFLPVSVSGPLVAHGSVNGLQNGIQGLLNAVEPSYSQQDSANATDRLSTDLNLSRYLVFYSSQPIKVAGIEEYFQVCGFLSPRHTHLATTRTT